MPSKTPDPQTPPWALHALPYLFFVLTAFAFMALSLAGVTPALTMPLFLLGMVGFTAALRHAIFNTDGFHTPPRP